MHALVTVLAFGLLTAAQLSIGAVGFTLQFGVTNVMNLGFGALMTSAIFITYAATQAHVPIWWAVVLAAVWGAAISLVLSTAIINPYVRRGTSLFGMAMVTIALALVVQYSLETIQGPTILAFGTQSPSEYHFLGIVMSELQVQIIAIAVVLMVAVHLVLAYTRLGLKMRATAADSSLTRSCGVSTRRVRSLAWLMSGALCGVAGAILGLSQGAFNAATGNEFFIVIVAAAIVGGVGQPYGAMLGALVIGIVSELAANFVSPAYKDDIAFTVLVLVLLLRPQGILAEFSSERVLAQ